MTEKETKGESLRKKLHGLADVVTDSIVEGLEVVSRTYDNAVAKGKKYITPRKTAHSILQKTTYFLQTFPKNFSLFI